MITFADNSCIVYLVHTIENNIQLTVEARYDDSRSTESKPKCTATFTCHTCSDSAFPRLSTIFASSILLELLKIHHGREYRQLPIPYQYNQFPIQPLTLLPVHQLGRVPLSPLLPQLKSRLACSTYTPVPHRRRHRARRLLQHPPRHHRSRCPRSHRQRYQNTTTNLLSFQRLRTQHTAHTLALTQLIAHPPCPKQKLHPSRSTKRYESTQ